MQKSKKLMIFLGLTALLAAVGFIHQASSAALTAASDTLSDSDLSVTATHTISFINNTAQSAGDYFQVVLPAAFGDISVGSITCPSGMTASSTNTETARCVSNAGTATGTKTILLSAITNPVAAGSQTITLSNNSGATVLENSDVSVAIIDNVDMSAAVPSVFGFTLSPLATGTLINGQLTTGAAATTSLAFGTLTVGTSTILGQELKVLTNATGFSITAEQDQNLTNGNLNDIDSFKDGTSSAPQAWSSPSGLIDQEYTYGHFGLTSEDTSLSGGDLFGNNLWEGFPTSTPIEIFYHNGPADESTPDKGATQVGYRLEISPLQEPGDYTNIITYIATPTF
jgi:hypothetical protein